MEIRKLDFLFSIISLLNSSSNVNFRIDQVHRCWFFGRKISKRLRKVITVQNSLFCFNRIWVHISWRVSIKHYWLGNDTRVMQSHQKKKGFFLVISYDIPSFLKINFYWSMVDLQFCVSARQQSESAIHIHISSLF